MSAFQALQVITARPTFLDIVNNVVSNVEDDIVDNVMDNVVGNAPVGQNPSPQNPHEFSLTSLQLLPRRLEYRRQKALRNPQAKMVFIDEDEVARVALRLGDVMWGRNGVEESESAEAAAILEAALGRGIVSPRSGVVHQRWMCDDKVCMPLLFSYMMTLTHTLDVEWPCLR